MERNMLSLSAAGRGKKKREKGAFSVVNVIILVAFASACLFPFVYELLLSFSSLSDFLSAKILVLPLHFNLESYKIIFFQDRIFRAFAISVGVTLAGTAYSMILTIFGAYALMQKDLPGKKLFFIMILIPMFFGGGLIPFYLTVDGLGLTDTLFSLFIPFGVGAFNLIILRNLLSQVPDSVIEACRMDGAGDFRILMQFVVPMSKAGIATISLFYLVERWNDWYWPMIFLENTDIYPLALELRNVLARNQSSGFGGGGPVDTTKLFAQGQEAAMVIVSMIPILCVYPFIQKYFVKGVMLGAVKN